MKGELVMSTKERQRLKVLEKVKDGLTLVCAAKMMRIGYRQARRIMRAYVMRGDAGLVHGNRGRPSNRSKGKEFKDRVLRVYEEKYPDFGPTFAAEKLGEAGDSLDHETLRRWLLAAGLWKKIRKRAKHRQMRERRARFGELVQMDGSHHKWFENRGEECCLIDMTDDATGECLGFFDEEETSMLALRVLQAWVKKYGIPMALYVDKKNVYVTKENPTIEEQLEGKKALTYFGETCELLGIEIIEANSPQAKGRIERAHGTHQDRLVKEMRLKGIDSIGEANRFVRKYFKSHNNRFAIEPRDKNDCHIPVQEGFDLDHAFSIKDGRTVSNDWTVRYMTKIFQILNQEPLPPRGAKVTVCKYLDKKIHIFHGKRELRIKEIANSPAKREKFTTTARKAKEQYKPPVDHPWRGLVLLPRGKGNSQAIEPHPSRRAATTT